MVASRTSWLKPAMQRVLNSAILSKPGSSKKRVQLPNETTVFLSHFTKLQNIITNMWDQCEGRAEQSVDRHLAQTHWKKLNREALYLLYREIPRDFTFSFRSEPRDEILSKQIAHACARCGERERERAIPKKQGEHLGTFAPPFYLIFDREEENIRDCAP